MLLNLNLSTLVKRLADSIRGLDLRKLGGARKATRGRSRLGTVESLESRQLLTTFPVNNLGDFTDNNPNVTTLREALTTANNTPGGDTIVFTGAAASGTINLSALLGPLVISDPVTIRGVAPNLTISAQNNSRVFSITSTAGNVTLDGLTITGGRTTANGDGGGAIQSNSPGTLSILNSQIVNNSTTGSTASGGAINIVSLSTLNIVNSTISGNTTSGGGSSGGAIYGYNGGTLTMTDSFILNNSTSNTNARGGGLYWYQGSITMNNSNVTLNRTQGGGATGGGIYSKNASITLTNSSSIGENTTSGANAKGGGVYSLNGAVTLTGSFVGGNSTSGTNADGGGFYSVSQPVTLTNSSLYGNRTTNSNSSGGGIATKSGNVTLLNSTISGNSTTGANSRGGGIYSSSGAVSVVSSTISGNSTSGIAGWGGGIRVAYGSLAVTNSTVSGNSATDAGGGLSVNSAPLTVTNSTIVLNTNTGSTFTGGGVFAFAGNVTLNNSIVALNTNAGAPDLKPGSGSLTINNSLIGNNLGSGLAASATPNGQGNLIGTNAAPINPVLGPLQFNGGPTQTHALLNSPAINRGSNTLANAAGLTLDQNGKTRFSGIVDMGAVEFQTPSATFSTASSSVNELGSPTVQITVNLSAASVLPVTVPFFVSGTASNPSDYTIAASPLVIPAGATSGTIQINVVDVIGFEPSETVILTFGSLTNATPGAITTTTLTILDFDSAPTASFSTATTSVNEGVGIVAVTVNLNFAVAQNVTIPYTVSGTASNPADFTIGASPLVIPAGQTSGTFNITVVDDALIESNETVIVTLGTPTNATLGTTTVNTLTIADNDLAPNANFSLAAQSVGEGAGNATLTVNLSIAASANVSIPFTITGTASNGADFSIAGSPLNIAAGATSGTITVNLVDDAVIEGNETVIVTLGAPTNATLGTTFVQTLTIADNDNNAAPTIPAGQTFTIAENSTVGSSVGTVVANDTDVVAPLNTLTFSLSSNPNNAFAINAASGQITVANQAALDFESSSSFNIGVTVTDGGGLSASQTVTVNLTNVNESPTISPNQSFFVAENIAAGTVVGTVASVDPDSAPPFGSKTYSLTSNPNNAFALNAVTGQITVVNGSVLDFETTSQFTLGVSVSDGGGLTANGNVIVNVTNVNESPTATGAGGTVTAVRNRNSQLLPGIVIADSDGATDLVRVVISYFVPRRTFASDYIFGNASSLGSVSETGPTDFRRSSGTRTMTITLNANTTIADVQSFLRSTTFQTRKSDPRRGPLGRRIDVQVFDSQENSSSLISTSIRVNRR